MKELSLTWDFDTTVYTLALNETWGVALGNLCWQPVSQTKRSEWYFVLSDCEKTAAFGVKTGCNSFCQWQIEPDRITLIIDVKNGGEGIELTEPLLCCTILSIVLFLCFSLSLRLTKIVWLMLCRCLVLPL